MAKELQKSTEFETLMSYAKAMHKRYFHAIAAFYAYEGLREVRAPNIVGQSDAEENAKTIGKYSFFAPAQESLRVYFFLELAKMFDSSKQSLHI
ncbi:MAG: hypothetical protein HYT38_02740, partial [Candidatus Sungbacteria bacterium]|nr:hypothetical protein [Candidatus Sungbacteria bacterium]